MPPKLKLIQGGKALLRAKCAEVFYCGVREKTIVLLEPPTYCWVLEIQSTGKRLWIDNGELVRIIPC